MTDRELLELAVKAAGMPQPPKGQEIPQHLPVVFTKNGKPWNPLIDDHDSQVRAEKAAEIPIGAFLGFAAFVIAQEIAARIGGRK